MNYSSAKTILFLYRKNRRKCSKVSSKATQVCAVGDLSGLKSRLEYELETTQGGEMPKKRVHLLVEENSQISAIKQTVDRIKDISRRIAEMNSLMSILDPSLTNQQPKRPATVGFTPFLSPMYKKLINQAKQSLN
eukprot:TRINITY_DN12261_c0_g1_i2.p1 TRINITY_DN12261_c0_g1~~TRINITY_DN12261_c0_g1_i2.p1  ORF type:complete len:135 (-),score=13.12 TRINITY_DN12261_c0_g1_i2:3-407(-)